ncbi:MAG: hypothetical protein LC721_11650, partial [Actinobacteria bacterium]|nr:hypothetical protein [Actinomycetota bacterium]
VRWCGPLSRRGTRFPMAGGGELVPRAALRGELLPPARPAHGEGGAGSVYADFMGRLRDYVAPPPPGELGWRACIGVGMIFVSAALLAILPAPDAIGNGGLLKWVGRSGLASTVDSVDGLVGPMAIFAMVVLLGVAAIYLTGWGAAPALVYLTAQPWIGVAALAVAVFIWTYLLMVFAINLAIWVLYITAWIVGGILVLRLFLSS